MCMCEQLEGHVAQSQQHQLRRRAAVVSVYGSCTPLEDRREARFDCFAAECGVQ